MTQPNSIIAYEGRRDQSVSRRVLLVWALIGVSVVALAAIIGPHLLVTQEAVPDAATRLNLQNDIRGTLLQATAGTLFLVTAFYGYQQLRVTQEQLKFSEAGRIADAYSEALERLESTAIEARVASLLALRRLETNAPGGTREIVAVASVFIRRYSSARGDEWATKTDEKIPPLPVRQPDIHEALKVVSALRVRLTWSEIANTLAQFISVEEPPHEQINFQFLDLRRADLRHGNLQLCDFQHARLAICSLTNTDFKGSNLSGANMAKAELTLAHFGQCFLIKTLLDRAKLYEANLTMANLSGALLRECDLRRAMFAGAYLEELAIDRDWGARLPNHEEEPILVPGTIQHSRMQHNTTVGSLASVGFFLPEVLVTGRTFPPCDLSGADLRGANFSEAAINGVNFSGARADHSTQWPDGFDPEAAGVVVA